MTLIDKIKSIYPSIGDTDFALFDGTITLQNDSDGRGDYIAFWNHPDYPRPTDEQLAAVEAA